MGPHTHPLVVSDGWDAARGGPATCTGGHSGDCTTAAELWGLPAGCEGGLWQRCGGGSAILGGAVIGCEDEEASGGALPAVRGGCGRAQTAESKGEMRAQEGGGRVLDLSSRWRRGGERA